MVRRQVWALLAVALVGGVGFGFVMTAASGARRTDSAYTRLRRDTLAPDAMFDGAKLEDADVRALAAAPEVSGIARFSYTPVAPSPLTPGVDSGGFVGLDPDFMGRIYRPLVLSGRLPAPEASDEVVINEALARRARLSPGRRVQVVAGFDRPVLIGAATVVGVVRGIFDVAVNSKSPSMLLTSAFLDRHHDALQLGPQPVLMARFARGEADLPAFAHSARAALGRDLPAAFSGSDEATTSNRTLNVQTIGLGILAVVAGVATSAALAQALSRLVGRALQDLPTLVAIGVQPRQRLEFGALLALPVVAVSVVVATAFHFLTSTFVPTGFARSIDPLRGHHVDALVVSSVVVVAAIAIVGSGVAVAWRYRPAEPRTRSTSRTRRVLRSLPTRMRLGGEAALVPARCQGGLASRSALVTAAISVAAVAAVATFGASLTHLLDSPSLQGWTFDATIVSETPIDELQRALAPLAEDRAVSGVGWATAVDLAIEGKPFEAFAFDPQSSARFHPTMRSGRPPVADDEIALGADLMRGGHVSLGDSVVVSGPTGQRRLRIVGSATYPELGNNADLGSAASLTRATAARIGAVEHGTAALIRLRPGYRAEAALAEYATVGEIGTPFRPPRVRNLEQIGYLPLLGITFASTLGLLAMAHGLWSSIRARRRDLWVLSSLGFRSRDIRAMHLWQATFIAVIASAVGIVAGVALGRRAWSAVAATTAVVEQADVPLARLFLIVAAALVGGLVVAVIEGRVAQRARTAGALSGE
jgi:hypothetical protein